MAGVLAVVAAGSIGAVVATSGSRSPRSITTSGPPSAAQNGTAVAWVLAQVAPATVVSCDPAMCAALVAQGYPAKNVRELSSATALKASGVVVVTPAALQLFGSSLVTAWAPAALATFGSGSSAISVRIVAPQGATAYEQRARKDRDALIPAETSLAQASSVKSSGSAAQDLESGRVDGRLFEALAEAAVAAPIDIVGFGNAGPGATRGVPLRYADLAASNPASGMTVAAYVQTLRASMSRRRGPSPARTQLLTLPGEKVLRVEFLAPSPFGVPNNP